MTDERYTFISDVRDKKRVARGYYNKVRQGGRIKMPSDYMNRKEKRKLNGEIKTYNLSAPMTWKAFRLMPDHIQVEYVEGLRGKYKTNGALLAKMFGVSNASVIAWGKAHNVKFPHCNSSREDRMKWDLFCTNGSDKPAAAEAPTEEALPVETVEMPDVVEQIDPRVEKPAVVERAVSAQKADLNNIAVLLSMLTGTGAKLTIEVTL